MKTTSVRFDPPVISDSLQKAMGHVYYQQHQTRIEKTKQAVEQINTASAVGNQNLVKELIRQFNTERNQAYSLASRAFGLPYLSLRRDIKNMNCRAFFRGAEAADDAEKIACRHFATHYLSQINSRQKFNFKEIDTLESIAKTILPKTEKDFDDIQHGNLENYLVENEQFGLFIANTFSEMAAHQTNLKKVMLLTPDHAMAVVLKTKHDSATNETHYVVNFYDPNSTNTHVRCFASDIERYKGPDQKLKNYVADVYKGRTDNPPLQGEERFETYFNKGCTTVICAILPDDPPNQASAVQRRLDTQFAGKNHCEKIWYALSENFPEVIEQVKTDFEQSADQHAMKEALSGHVEGYHSPLNLALFDQHSEAIAAYAALLNVAALEPAVLEEILAAKDKAGTPLLNAAMRYNQVPAINAYAHLLNRVSIPEDVMCRLLLACNAEGTPALYSAMTEGNAAAIKAYGHMLSLSGLPDHLKRDLLMAKVGDTEFMAVALETIDLAPTLFGAAPAAYQSVLALNGYDLVVPQPSLSQNTSI